MLNAAAAAAAAGFPYQIPGYPTMFPFLPPTEDVRRSMQSSRRHSPRRSPSYRRRSRSPIESRGRNSYDRYRDGCRSRDRRRPSPLPPRRGSPPSEIGGRRHHYDRTPPRIPDRRRR
uniref:Female-specific protein transformer n=1 Tax=Mesocestoides corti TaxID=53468 RepID=A0A5K3ENV5_MESCO